MNLSAEARAVLFLFRELEQPSLLRQVIMTRLSHLTNSGMDGACELELAGLARWDAGRARLTLTEKGFDAAGSPGAG
jgi:hypothetical protein